MKPDPNYPRMMFHRTLAPVTVHSEAEERALGPEWSRTIPAEEPPAEPEEPGEPDEPEEEKPEERQPLRPPVRKPVKPAATRQWRQH
jgi:hypothetical protein